MSLHDSLDLTSDARGFQKDISCHSEHFPVREPRGVFCGIANNLQRFMPLSTWKIAFVASVHASVGRVVGLADSGWDG